MSDSNDNVPVGGGQPPLPPLGGASFEAEEKALKKGRGRMMAAMIGGVLAALAALAFFMAPDERETYREFGKKVNGLDEQYFDAFWACAFQNVDLRNLRTNEDLEAQIQRRSGQATKRYGAYVRDRCLPKLTTMEPKLEALLPPDDFKTQIRELSRSLNTVRSSWSEFIAYLDTVDEYDQDLARPGVSKISKGWYDYRRAHSALNKSLRERLEH